MLVRIVLSVVDIPFGPKTLSMLLAPGWEAAPVDVEGLFIRKPYIAVAALDSFLVPSHIEVFRAESTLSVVVVGDTNIGERVVERVPFTVIRDGSQTAPARGLRESPVVERC